MGALHHSPGILGKGRIVGRHLRGHGVAQEHCIHALAAFQQLGHRVFAVNQLVALVFGALGALGALGLLRAALGGTVGARGKASVLIFSFHHSFFQFGFFAAANILL